ncbi:MAG TPA: DNA-processing protein DprA [Candidatus Binatia bacterium]|jgi:predicted Rossmann fold nucleotide-binding protein DprA/Smf involved in DNA uptake
MLTPAPLVVPPDELESTFGGGVPKLWYCGELALLKNQLLGVVSAREIEPDLALKTAELIEQLTSIKVTFIGGWHSPLEEEALRILLRGRAPIVFCVAKTLEKFVPLEDVRTVVAQGRGLLLTHCSPKARRISRDASLRRNEIFLSLARALLVLSAPPRSASAKLAEGAVKLGKPVFAIDHRVNQDLLASGVLPATFENISQAFQ